MGRYHRHGVESSATIAGHPLHHMLVVFPIAFLIGAFATDIAFRSTADTFWARASYWLLLSGIVTALIAAIPGLVDFMSIDRVRNIWVSWAHMIGNLAVVGLAAINLWLRWDDPAAGAQGWGLTLSGLTTALLFFSGWLGGELAYRYRIGSIDDQSPEVEQFHVEVDRRETSATETTGQSTVRRL
ncbi:MAG TPA: DUF2231 domain-containing protein [Microvirga sp.]|nr:DUF2231 domain-containing protein [Microvirga sp.]